MQEAPATAGYLGGSDVCSLIPAVVSSCNPLYVLNLMCLIKLKKMSQI